jgi:hypothetical protein
MPEPTEEQFRKTPLRYQASVIGPRGSSSTGFARWYEKDVLGMQFPDSMAKLKTMPAGPFGTRKPHDVFWGWISYRDVFQNLHVTEFCQELDMVAINIGNPQDPFSFAYAPCLNHNCADQYCEDYKEIAALAQK